MKPILKAWVTHGLCLGFGLWIGWEFGPTKMQGLSTNPPEKIVAASERVERGKAKIRESKPNSLSEEQIVLAGAFVPKGVLESLTPPLFSFGSLELSHERLKKLDLSEEQIILVKNLVSETFKAIQNEEQKVSQIRNSGIDQYLEIDAFPDQGSHILLLLKEGLAAITKDGRSEIIFGSLKKNIRFGRFGVQKREIAMESKIINGAENWGYKIVYPSKTGQPEYEGGSSYNEILNQRYGSLIKEKLKNTVRP